MEHSPMSGVQWSHGVCRGCTASARIPTRLGTGYCQCLHTLRPHSQPESKYCTDFCVCPGRVINNGTLPVLHDWTEVAAGQYTYADDSCGLLLLLHLTTHSWRELNQDLPTSRRLVAMTPVLLWHCVEFNQTKLHKGKKLHTRIGIKRAHDENFARIGLFMPSLQNCDASQLHVAGISILKLLCHLIKFPL